MSDIQERASEHTKRKMELIRASILTSPEYNQSGSAPALLPETKSEPVQGELHLATTLKRGKKNVGVFAFLPAGFFSAERSGAFL